MTDLELTKACAEAMGLRCAIRSGMAGGASFVELLDIHNENSVYDPLHDDAQAMALVKKFELHLCPPDATDGRWEAYTRRDEEDPDSGTVLHALAPDLNRAICECVAKLKV